jgi:CHASE3 domain sensor protein
MAGEKARYTPDEYSNKELREMIAKNAELVSAMKTEQAEIRADIRTILENQKNWMAHCNDCSKGLNEEIAALQEDTDQRFDSLEKTVVKHSAAISTINKVLAGAWGVVLMLAGWLWSKYNTYI